MSAISLEKQGNRDKEFDGWKSLPLSQTGRYINGLAFKPSDWGEKGLPIIRIQNLTDSSKPFNRTTREVDSAYRVTAGDILVSWSATLDAFVWDQEPGLLNQHIFKVVPDEKVVTKKFLFYTLKEAIAEMVKSEHLHGSTMKHINRGPFLAHRVSVPPLKVQQQVVAEIEKQFSRLDEAVANLLRVKANLKHYKASVLRAAAEGRLVSTEAELARREGRSYETGEQLRQRILDTHRNQEKRPRKSNAFEATMGDTPPLPEGWSWSSIGELAEVGTGATPNRSNEEYWDHGDVPWVTSAVVNFDYVDKPSEFVTHRALSETNLTLYPAGTLLIAMYGEGKTRGKCAELRIPATTNQALAAVQAHAQVRDYLRHFLELNYQEMRKVASGGVQPNLNLSLVRSVAVPLPPLAEQRRIVAEVDRHISIIRGAETALQITLQRAQVLRQAVLQRMLTHEQVAPSHGVAVSPVADSLSMAKRPILESVPVVLAARIIAANCGEPTFGRVKLQKILFLATYHGKIEAANDEYTRRQAGPLDMQMLKGTIKRVNDLGWFREFERAGISSADRSYTYEPLAKADEYKQHLSVLTQDQIKVTDDLGKLMRRWPTVDCELFATVYAAWNDLLMWKREPTADAIIQEVRENWHESKQKFSPAQISGMIGKIEALGYTPTGFGRPTSGVAADTVSADLFSPTTADGAGA